MIARRVVESGRMESTLGSADSDACRAWSAACISDCRSLFLATVLLEAASAERSHGLIVIRSAPSFVCCPTTLQVQPLAHSRLELVLVSVEHLLPRPALLSLRSSEPSWR